MTSGKRRKRGGLTPEDRELWSKVTKTAKPLHPNRPAPVAEPENLADLLAEADEPKKVGGKRKPATTSTALRQPKAAVKAPPPLHQLEHRYRKQLVRGVKAIDARIDLHGLRQHQAHDHLRGFLYEAQARGHKVVLVITGKGSAGSSGRYDSHHDERGVLRRVVPQWLSMPDMRHIVLGYEEAHLSHGGSGALYVRIRRRR